MEQKKNDFKGKAEILAPAGSRASFLSAIAAGADAVYCGLKQFSARMAAANFSFEELAALTQLAHDRGTKVYVAFNTLVKPGELGKVELFLKRLKHEIDPDALIVQDLSLAPLARKAGFKKELHLSTLANVSFPEALKLVRQKLDVCRTVLPRELNIDEIRQMAAACPQGLGLEVFVHGALCYGVSGRCYWSSYFGGKSGLRGRCVQPCRRRYRIAGDEGRFFSCQDLSLDVLVKVLHGIPQIRAWKIEGRKKGPHYVYYTVTAYKMLRDQGGDPQKKRAALKLLEMALGRVSTHYGFLPQRPQNPVKVSKQTGSGFLMGYVQGPQGQPYVIPREALMAGDVLRIGYEDDAWHTVRRVRRAVPAKGRYHLKAFYRDRRIKGVPVFLVDRLESHLGQMISRLESELVIKAPRKHTFVQAPQSLRKSARSSVGKAAPWEMRVHRSATQEGANASGIWLSPEALSACPKSLIKKRWWWLPPVVWPEKSGLLHETIDKARHLGAHRFVLNIPWQSVFFKSRGQATLWAGPFCNIANGQAIQSLKQMGVSGVVVSPELGKREYLALPAQSVLPLGIVLSANWPLCISRTLADNFKEKTPFTSPKGESAWTAQYGSDYWLFPNWQVDLRQQKRALVEAGYTLLVHMAEPVPRSVKIKRRPGLWNWELGLK